MNCHSRHTANLLRLRLSYCVAQVSCIRILFRCMLDSHPSLRQNSLLIWLWIAQKCLCMHINRSQLETEEKNKLNLTPHSHVHLEVISRLNWPLTYTTDRIFVQCQPQRSLCFTQCPRDDSTALGLCTNVWITNCHLNNRAIAVDLNVLHQSGSLQ